MLLYKTFSAILFQKVNIVLFPPATSSSNSGAKVKDFCYCRVSLLELVLAHIEMSGSDECGVAPGVARFLADCFQNSCGAVLKLSTDACASDDEVWRGHLRDNLFISASSHFSLHSSSCSNSLWLLQEALTVITLLNVLCEMTSGSRQFLFLQDHPELLAATVGR